MAVLQELPSGFVLSVAFVLGACIGSFLNVVIYRLPREESLVAPGSHCPGCQHPIAPWANVPLLSYLLLRGRCRHCGMAISPRYPLVEALTAILFTLIAWQWLERGIAPRLFVDLALIAALIAVTFIDWDEQIIPNVITYPGMLLGLLLAWASPPPPHVPVTFSHFFYQALLGMVIAGGAMLALSEGYRRLRGHIGLGMGDVKLIAMLGAFLGLRDVLGTLVIGSLAGLVYGLWLIGFRGGSRRTRIPFGPALAGAGILYVFAPGLLDRVLGA